MTGRPLPAVDEPAPGIWSVPAAIPGSPLGYSLMYLVAHPDGAALVDAGLDNPQTRAALAEALRRAGRREQDITHVLLTHHHPDHTGLAETLRRDAGAVVAIGAGDADPLRDPLGRFLDLFTDELIASGVPADVFEAMLAEVRATAAATNTRGIEPDLLIEPGAPVALGSGSSTRRLETLPVPGHTAGHLAFVDRERGVALCGDALLPSGLVQLDVLTTPESDPLADLLRSLQALAELNVALALPGHIGPFGDVATVAAGQRARQLERRNAVARVLEAEPGLSAYEVCARLSPRPWEELSPVSRRYQTMEIAAVMRSLGRFPAQPARPT